MNAKALILLLLAPLTAQAQGFAGLGTEAPGFTPVTPPASLEFPRDYGAHPGFRIEWWYLTANLETAAGEPLGAQWTLFRQALAPGPEAEGWASNAVWMGHAALTDARAHRFAETFARGGIGQAGAVAEPFAAWIDDWSMTGDSPAKLRVTASGEGFAYDLAATATLPPVPQGTDGYSVKSAEGQASYYYSQPFYTVAGTVTRDGVATPVTGTAWLDREWSSQPLGADQTGWDWFALSLESGARVMLFALNSRTAPPFLSGTWIAPDGTPTPLAPGEISLTPLATTKTPAGPLPTRWRIAIPSRSLDVEADALNPDAWMATLYPYWEGPIRLTGTHPGTGYLEMTGARAP